MCCTDFCIGNQERKSMDEKKTLHSSFEADWDTKEYEVSFIYSVNDENREVSAMFGKGLAEKEMDADSIVEIVEISAVTLQGAIEAAYKIILANRAEMLTDYIVDNPLYREESDEPKQTWTREELMALHKMGVKVGIFSDFILMEPTAIQASLKTNRKALEDMSLRQATSVMSRISDDAEEYLKGKDNGHG